MQLFRHSFDTRLGRFRSVASEEALLWLDLPGRSREDFDSMIECRFPQATPVSGGLINERTEQEVCEYLEKGRTTFTVPWELVVPEFCRRVLTEVSAIPYGHTKSYGEIARALGSPGSARAVGTANARNPLPIIIPCHRVVAATGIGGYGGGVSLKRELLRLEGLSLF